MPFQLALITGASSGLGKTLAHLLAEKKIPLFLTARDPARLEKVKAELSEKVPVFTHECDLGDCKKRKSLIPLIHQKTPDLIINCAGFGLYGPCLDHPTEESLSMIEVDVSALTEITIEAARALEAQNRKGTILNVSSAAAFFSYPTFAIYAATKGYVKQFSEAMDVEVKPKGIRVLCACPGQIRTDFRRRAAKDYPQQDEHQSMSVESSAHNIWKQIESGKSVYIFDWRYRMMVFLSRLFPKKLVHQALKKSIENRYSKT